MSRFLSLKLLATVGFKSRAVTRFRAAAVTGAGSNLVRHFSLGQALGVNLVKPAIVNYKNETHGPPSIAVILSGCGFLDGSNVHEAVNTMMHITRHNINPTCFAPKGRQLEVVDHVSRRTDDRATRSILQESARMTTKGVRDLENLYPQDHLGLIVPGGNGISYNLTDFFTRLLKNAIPFAEFDMDDTLNQILLEFYCLRKPIGFLGDASMLAARVFHGVRITFGDQDTQTRTFLVLHAKDINAIPVDTPPYTVYHDTNYNIFSTRASLLKPFSYYNLSRDIGNLVDHMVRSIRQHNRR